MTVAADAAAKVAFLVPIYPPHFAYAHDLLTSFRQFRLDTQSDLWFVFTNEEEHLLFGEYPNALVLPHDLRVFENKGIINIKKFYGLHQIQDQYEYIIILDAESLFIRSVDVFTLCEEYFAAKILLGNTMRSKNRESAEGIKKSCRRFFADHPDFDKLNNSLYLWFNQPCIYKTDTLSEFWTKIAYANNIKSLRWTDFDYYIYMFYLILFQGFQIEDMEIESEWGVCEAVMHSLSFKSDKYKSLPILMVSQIMLDKFDNPRCFITVHVDRIKKRVMHVMMQIDRCVQQIQNMNDQINQLAQSVQEIKHQQEQKELKDQQKIQNMNDQIDHLVRQVQDVKHQQERSKLKNRLRKWATCLIPFKKLRKKVRGDQ